MSESPVVLVVGFPTSVHTSRWIGMMLGRGIRFVLLPVHYSETTALGSTRRICDAKDLAGMTDREIGMFDLSSVADEQISGVQAQLSYQPWCPGWMPGARLAQPGHVVAAVRRLRPVIVHSMVVQFGGYLCLACHEYLRGRFPLWLLSNWGSDIFLFRMLPEHRERILRIMSAIDGYHAECERDFGIARELGFRGFTFPCLPASGGMNFEEFPPVESFPPPSQRREILIKGYHGWAGRALHILAAVHLAAESLRGCRLRITLSTPAVEEMAATLAKRDGLDIVIETYLPDHREALLRLANARMVIGLGISDGISTTLLEAMAVGTFPVQGGGSCGNEWFRSGETGMLISPHDIGELADSIRRIMSDNTLVDDAALQNRRTVEARWNAGINSNLALQSYQGLMETTPVHG